MANPSREAQIQLVRLLYLEHGHQIASEMSKVPYATVRKWASRYGWNKDSKSVTNVTKTIVQRVEDELATNEKETRLSLSRYARRAAKDSENATLRESPLVHKAAQIAGIVHRWSDQAPGQQFTLNVLNINSLDVNPE